MDAVKPSMDAKVLIPQPRQIQGKERPVRQRLDIPSHAQNTRNGGLAYYVHNDLLEKRHRRVGFTLWNVNSPSGTWYAVETVVLG